MPDWTIDTRVDITDAGRDFVKVLRQRQTARPMLRCCICGQPVRVAFDDETGTEAVPCEQCDREEALRRAEEERCPTCDGRGVIPVGAAGNIELETNCPDCTPEYR